jgi:allophanate hydrolase subunit 1
LETPRQEIPAGTVGIAESQTGIYPVASPGGWRLIGRTPLKLFDPSREVPSLLSAGDYLRFVPIDGEEEFRTIEDSVAAGKYETTKSVKL